MKRIHIIRHAKSDWSIEGQRDIDRTLNARGLANAPMMASRFASKYGSPDLIICSPAKRTFETCQFFCQSLAYDLKKVFFEEKIYEAPLENLIHVVEAISDSNNEVLFIGHNYGVSQLVHYLCEELIAMPTCAIASIDLEVEHWKEVYRGCGQLITYDFPKNLNL